VLRDIEWRIAPGERTGIVGANGAGKSTLLGLIAGTVSPSSGRVKRGKTVRLAMLDQEAGRLADIEGDLVREVIATLQTGYVVDGKELTPAQLLERLGFRREQLSSRVGELSGGQRRRLQLTLTLLDEPNVLVLDEPTNDVDIDMLAATEDLLDSWPGTLIVVSHDRYLLERVTDQQYAVIDGRLRHLPGGVDEYLRIAARREKTEPAPTVKPEQPTGLAGAQLRSAQKEVAALERVLAKLAAKVDAKHIEIAGHDQADHVGIGRLTKQLRDLEGELSTTENRWLHASEVLESGG
jgi:ABC-type multidrug transport system ATPase subunit